MVVAVVAAVGLLAGDEAPPPRPDIPLDVWAPYWALDDSLPEFRDRVGSMREVSPFWFTATGVDRIVIDPNAVDDGTDEFIEVARRADVAIVPSIVDTLPAGEMAAILADPETRSQHVEAIVDFASEYDGVDLDYEKFAFSDGRDSWPSTRPVWVAFIVELGAALHADGKTLTVSIPPVYDTERTPDSGFWVYDHGAIAPHVDRIRIMAYDFSVGEPGPIAPLSFVERSVDGVLEATGTSDKLVLGVPAYGRNWAIGTSGECRDELLDGTVSVTARSIDDLIARRGGAPTFVEQTGEWVYRYELAVDDPELPPGAAPCVQTREVHWVDGEGVRLRMDLARDRRLDGVSLWALGFEDDRVWDAILPTVSDPSQTSTTSE